MLKIRRSNDRLIFDMVIPCLKDGLYIETWPWFLTHWGRVTHICVGKLTIIDSDNGLSPGRRQAIIWTNAGILLIGPLGTNFNEILIGIQTFSFTKKDLKMSEKWRPFCLSVNGLNTSLVLDIDWNDLNCTCLDIPAFFWQCEYIEIQWNYEIHTTSFQ